MEENQLPPPPRLKGVVIIQLPPPDNPSAGKTITAFTVTEDDYNGGYPQLQQHTQQISTTLPEQQQEGGGGGAGSRLPVRRPIPSLETVQTRLCAVVIYASLFSDTLQELKRSSNDDQDRKSFLLPLYSKLASPPFSKKGIDHTVERLSYRENSVVSIDHLITPLKVNKLSSSSSAKVGIDSSPIFPVKGNISPDGFYYTYILLGSPPRPYFLDIDTGSDLSWIQCDAPCTSCAKGANDLYKPKTSNMVLPEDSYCQQVQKNMKAEKCNTCKQCDYEIEYADHSSSLGVLVNDKLHLSSENESSKSKFTFGCAYDQQGFLLNTLASTDGILGLSRAKVSFPSQLASQGIIANVVGHCLTTDVTGGGYMFLGDELLPQRGVRWVPMVDIPFTDFYQTEIMKLTYGSSILSLGGESDRQRRVVFDSGSSFTYLTKEAYSELVASLKEVVRGGLVQDTSDQTMPLCWSAESPIRSIADVKQYFKTLTLQFGSKWWIISRTFRVPPDGYLIISEKGNVCLGILDGSKLLDGSTMILGDISLRGQLVVYDNEKKRIGWMPSDCVKPKRLDQQLPLFDGRWVEVAEKKVEKVFQSKRDQ
ncbi:Aspartyl protease APCB1 [Linum perenne]